MKLSARNQIKGKIVGVQKGQTTGHVRIDIGNGVIITSSITRTRPLTISPSRWATMPWRLSRRPT